MRYSKFSFSLIQHLYFAQLFQHYPVLSPFYTEYEKNFHASSYVNFAQNTWPALPLALCGIYGLMIVVGTKVMGSRPKHEWKTALACWNLLLSVFSFCGMVRTVPHLLHNVTTLPFKVVLPIPYQARRAFLVIPSRLLTPIVFKVPLADNFLSLPVHLPLSHLPFVPPGHDLPAPR